MEIDFKISSEDIRAIKQAAPGLLRERRACAQCVFRTIVITDSDLT